MQGTIHQVIYVIIVQKSLRANFRFGKRGKILADFCAWRLIDKGSI